MQLSPDTYFAPAIGRRLALARTRAGFALEDPAKACMMEIRGLAAAKRGTRAVPDDALLCRLTGLDRAEDELARVRGGLEPPLTALREVSR